MRSHHGNSPTYAQALREARRSARELSKAYRRLTAELRATARMPPRIPPARPLPPSHPNCRCSIDEDLAPIPKDARDAPSFEEFLERSAELIEGSKARRR